MSNTSEKITRDLQLAFDVGHSSIGWAVLQAIYGQSPQLLGCGSVIFPADDCLASTRRTFRRQRRHIRATRLRIARLRRLFEHLGVLTKDQLEAPGCAWPWLLAARVLRGGSQLAWPELWDVLRWYAHNRGYDGNKGWTRQEASAANEEDTAKEKVAHELLDAFARKYGRDGTMAEVFCDVLKVDPLGPLKSSMQRVRNLGAAFPREGVEAEVERILRFHLNVLPQVDEPLITAIMRDYTAIPGPDYRLPGRYGQRLADGSRSPGGLLFGQLVPRFENRIISRCPITFQRVYTAALAGTLTQREQTRRFDAEFARLTQTKPDWTEERRGEKAAGHIAEIAAKVPNADCHEFYLYRWVMQLANVQIAINDPRKTRRLEASERAKVHAEMVKQGALTPKQFKDAVRALTAGAKDNLEQMLALPDADKALVLDPAKKRVASGVLSVLWPHLAEAARKHTLTNLRRGKSVTARSLLAVCPPAAQAAFDHWWDGQAMKKFAKGQVARTREQVLDEPHSLKPDSGRAPYTREVLREVADFVLKTNQHPTEGTEDGTSNGPLFRSAAIRQAQLKRELDEQTNNHLVRHRLKLLERLHTDLLQEYAGRDANRIDRITIEVNRDLKEMSGKTAQEQAKEQGQQTFQFRSVEKKLAAAYEGRGIHLSPGLIRKARLAEDLGWKCPYTGFLYDEFALLDRNNVDKDHIIPRSLRPSDSLDSLVITLAEINRWKGQRTAVQFVEQEQGKPVPGRSNLMIKTLSNYLKDVEALETFKGHGDDQRRKKNRKRFLLLRDYIEKEFTPGDLTQTSQLVRLGAQALQKHYLGCEKAPVITSLPGSVTGAVRKSWNLIGCLALANPLVLNPDDLDEHGKPKVHRKTEIRGITHLHHALDACVLGFASLRLPLDGQTWNKEVVALLAKRRLNAAEQAILRAHLHRHIAISAEGEPRIQELPVEQREQIRQRLAERRVVQHLPSDLSGMDSKETVWRVFDPADLHPNSLRLGRWLAEAEITVPASDAKIALIICRKRKNAVTGEGEGASGKVLRDTKTWRWVYDAKDKTALLGIAPDGDWACAKLKKLKAAKVLGDNFGIALDPEPTLIRPHKVWHQLEKLRSENDGQAVRLLRKGTLIQIEKKSARSDYRGVWVVRGAYFKQKGGYMVDLSPADYVEYRRIRGAFETVSVTTLCSCGLRVLKPLLCGVHLIPIYPKPEASLANSVGGDGQ